MEEDGVIGGARRGGGGGFDYWLASHMRRYHAQCNCYRHMLHIRMLFYGFEQLCFVIPIGFLCNLIVILF